MSVNFEKTHFRSGDWLMSMVVGEERLLPIAACSYKSIKSRASQLLKKGYGEWKITKKGCTECTKVTRVG